MGTSRGILGAGGCGVLVDATRSEEAEIWIGDETMMQTTILWNGVAAVSGTAASVLAVLPSTELASEWGKLGAAAILGVVCVVTLWTGYKSQCRAAETLDRMSESNSQLASEISRLTARMSDRPCLRERG